MSEDCSLYGKRVAYFLTGFNLISGIINTIMGTYILDFLQITGGIISLIAGAILFGGILKENSNLVLIYLIIETVIFTVGTICGLLLMIVLVYVSAQIVEAPRHVNIGNTVVIDKYISGIIAFVALILIIVIWIMHFLIYIFYDDMAARNRAQSQIVEDTEVQYNVIINDTNDFNEANKIVFLNKNKSTV